jgi:hypothetical protein
MKTQSPPVVKRKISRKIDGEKLNKRIISSVPLVSARYADRNNRYLKQLCAE